VYRDAGSDPAASGGGDSEDGDRMNANYSMVGDKVEVRREENDGSSVTYRLDYEDLQHEIDVLTLDIFQYPNAKLMQMVLAEMRGAMAYLRERLTVEQANAAYASETNCSWAHLGTKGGES
jgi:hypothetical protein